MDFVEKYLNVLRGTLSGLNLTAIKNEADFKNKQYLDSLAPLEQCEEFRQALLQRINVDVGFGGGFPLLPLACAMPNKTFLGIEARRKKVDAVKTICKEINIHNVKVFHQRLEELHLDSDCNLFFKAVGRPSDFLSKVNSSKNVYCFFYKGPKYLEEDDFNLPIFKNWDLYIEKKLSVPGTDCRVLLGFKLIKKQQGRNTNNALSQLAKNEDEKWVE